MRTFSRAFPGYPVWRGWTAPMSFIEQRPEGVLLRIRLQPRASRNEAAGESNGRLRVKVTAPPVDGAANEAAVKYLSKTLGVPKSSVRLVKGQKAREKDFLIYDTDAAKIKAAFE